MLSPTAVPDPTGGIFAQAQMRPRASEDELETLRDAAPGEVVALPSAKGEVLGQVFLMSGGGKGPAGKSRAKYKSESLIALLLVSLTIQRSSARTTPRDIANTESIARSYSMSSLTYLCLVTDL